MKQEVATRFGIATSVAVAVALGVLGQTAWRNGVDAMLAKSGSNLYGALLGASTSLLGFMLATLAIAAGLASVPRAEVLKQRNLFMPVYRAFFRPIWPLAVVALLALAGLFAPTCRWILYGTTLFLGFTVFPLVYSIKVLHRLLEAVSRPNSEEKPTASEDYDRP